MITWIHVWGLILICWHQTWIILTHSTKLSSFVLDNDQVASCNWRWMKVGWRRGVCAYGHVYTCMCLYACVRLHTCMCLHVSVYACIHAYTCVCVCMCLCACMRPYTCMCLHMSVHACMRLYMCMCLHVSVSACMHVSIRVCVCMCLCMCVFFGACEFGKDDCEDGMYLVRCLRVLIAVSLVNGGRFCADTWPVWCRCSLTKHAASWLVSPRTKFCEYGMSNCKCVFSDWLGCSRKALKVRAWY